MEKRNPAKNRNFSDVEIETLTSQVQSFFIGHLLHIYILWISPQVFKKYIIVSLNFYTESIVALKYTLWLYNAFKFKQN